MKRLIIIAGLVLPIAAACGQASDPAPAPEETAAATLLACDPDNGGITLPEGFCALVVADDLGAARHLAVAPNGDLYVAIRNQDDAPGGIVALRDTDGDGGPTSRSGSGRMAGRR